MRFNERKRLYLSLGIEQAETELQIDPESFNEGDSVAANEIESVGDVKEIGEDVDQLDDFTESTVTASDLNVAVEAALASGKGLNRIEAAALTKALQASVGRYVTIENNLVPAVESYDIKPYDERDAKNSTGSNNKEQTTTAKKGIKEGIKAFIDAIIKKIKSIIIAAKGFFKKIYDRMTLSVKRLKVVFDRLEKGEYFGEQKAKYNITNIYMEGGFSPDKFAESMMVLLFAVGKIVGDIDNSASEQEAKFLSDGIEALKKADIDMWDKVRIALRAYMATSFSAMLEGKISKQEGGMVVSETFPGGKRLVFNPGSDTGTNQLPTISFQRTDKPEGDPTVEINLPDRDTFNGLLKASISLLSSGRTSDRSNSFSEAYEEVIKKLDAVKTIDDAKIEGNKEILTSISMFTGSSSAFRSKILWFSIDQISGICQMAELAIKLHDESKKDQNKEDAKTA